MALVAGGGGSGGERAARATPVQAAGSVVVLRFAGPALPPYVRRALRERRAAGVVLFADNLVARGQATRLTAAVHRARADALVMVDQEGGAGSNVPWAGPARAQPAQADPRAEALAGSRGLRATGIDVALAPVADVPSVPGSIAAGRGFSRDPAAASRAVAAAVRGWRAGGVLPTAKHFPGLGGAAVNTDDGPVTVTGTPQLAPFRAAIAAGVPLVMVDSARHPALDPERIAAQSRRVVEGLLRRRLGFRGVVISDSLEAAAVRATGSLERSAQRSVRAGVDLLLTTGQGSYLRIVRSLSRAARRDPGLRRRLDEAAARIAALSPRG